MVLTRRRAFYGLLFLLFFLTSGLAMADKLPPPTPNPLTNNDLLALTEAPTIFVALSAPPTKAVTDSLLSASERGHAVYVMTPRKNARSRSIRLLKRSQAHVRLIDQPLHYSFVVANPLLSVDADAALSTVAIGECLVTSHCDRHFYFRGHDKAARSLTYEFLFLWQHGFGEPGSVGLSNKALPTSRAGDFVLTSAQIAPLQLGRFWRFHAAVKPKSGVLSYQLRGLTASARETLVISTPRLDRRDLYQNFLTTARRGVALVLRTPIKPAAKCRDIRFPDGAAEMAACLKQAGTRVERVKTGRETFLIADDQHGFYTPGGLTIRNEVGAFSLGALFEMK